MEAQQQDRVSATEPPATGSDRPDCPYIGLKPYSEKERPLFFGRERDAEFLVNKILSAPLSLVYGMSGVGKSSLLRARVVPDLRRPDIAGALVVYLFDCWTETDVEAAIKRAIERKVVERASQDSGSRPGPAGTLLDWTRHVNEALSRPLVLILDQFEQFLLHRAGRLDPLRKEIAALVRAKADVYVVLALREEYLASLAVFTHDIVRIYDSTYRLEHLSDDGAREAIVCPAQAFGVVVQPELADALIRDLKTTGSRQVAEHVGPAMGGANIELPILQIVCQQLWKNRDPASPKRLTLGIYDRKGQCAGIIEGYVADLTRGLRADEQDAAAAILDCLAPTSGLKTTCSADQLVRMTNIPADRVQKLLSHLANNWVLRTTAGGGYELYHDAFIRVLRKWIDKRLADARKRRLRHKVTRSAASIVAASILILVIFGVSNWLAMPDLQKQCRDDAAQYERLLENKRERSQVVAVLIYNPSGVDPNMLQCLWEKFNKNLRKSGSTVLLPLRVAVQPDRSQPIRIVDLKLLGRGDKNEKDSYVSIDISPQNYDQVLFENLPEPFDIIFARAGLVAPVAGDLPSITSIPIWTYQLLRAFGVYPSYPVSAETGVVAAVVRQLLADNRQTLTQRVVDQLLFDTARSSPETVGEAISAQGSKGAQDAAERIRNILLEVAAQSKNQTGLIFAHPDLILDSMAHYAALGHDAHAVAHEILEDLQSSAISLDPALHLHGAELAPPPEESDLLTAYDLSPGDLPKHADQPRVELGKDLVPCVFDESGDPRRTVDLLLRERRTRHEKRFGVTLPQIQFSPADQQTAHDAIRIEIAGQYYGPFHVEQGDCLSQVVDKAFSRLELSRIFWLRSEDVRAALRELPVEQAEWLRDRFSLTDLKMLARAILAPDRLAPDREEIFPAELSPTLDQLGKSVHNFSTLLRSLVFWRQACRLQAPANGFDSLCLTDGLRQTQAAQFEESRPDPIGNSRVTVDVAHGIAQLFGFAPGGTTAADKTFAKSVEAKKDQAIPAFLSEYPIASQLFEVKRHCGLRPGNVLSGDKLRTEDRRIVEAALARLSLPNQWAVFAPMAVPLRLCLLRSDLLEHDLRLDIPGVVDVLDGLLLRPPKARADWTAEEAFALGVMALHLHSKELWRSGEVFTATKVAITNVLQVAFDRWAEEDNVSDAEAAFDEARDECWKALSRRWCFSVLEGELKRFGQPTFRMQVDLGMALAQLGSPREARDALTLLSAAEHMQGSVDIDASQRAAWLSYLRAEANLSLAEAVKSPVPEDRIALVRAALNDLVDLDRILDGVRSDKIWPPRTDIARLVMEAAWLAQHPEMADEVVDELPESTPGFAALQFMSQIRRGDLRAAKAAIERDRDLTDTVRLLLRGLVEFLAGEPDATKLLQKSLGSDNEYDIYARLILYVALIRADHHQEARKILDDRPSMDLNTADDRLTDGDPTPWREMLLLYYRNGAKADDFQRLLAVIDKTGSSGEPLLAGTGESRAGYLSELHFYDALLQSVTGDPQTRMQRERDSLRKAVDANGVTTYEYAMADYLLRSLDSRH